MSDQYQVPIDNVLGDATGGLGGEADFDSLPPGPAGPTAVPVNPGLPPGPAGPQAIQVHQPTPQYSTSSPVAQSTPPPPVVAAGPPSSSSTTSNIHQGLENSGQQQHIAQQPSMHPHPQQQHPQPQYVQHGQQQPTGVQYVYVQQQQHGFQQQPSQQMHLQQPQMVQQPQQGQQQGHPPQQYQQQQVLYTQQQPNHYQGHPNPNSTQQYIVQQPQQPHPQVVHVRQPGQQQVIYRHAQPHPGGQPRPQYRLTQPQQPTQQPQRAQFVGQQQQQQSNPWTGGQQQPRPMQQQHSGAPQQRVQLVQLKPGETLRPAGGHMQHQYRMVQRAPQFVQRVGGVNGQPVRVVYQQQQQPGMRMTQPPQAGQQQGYRPPASVPQVIRQGQVYRPRGPPPTPGVRPQLVRTASGGTSIVVRPGETPASTAAASDIAYDVEHVFNENGKEVRKMPIKMGTATYWVDVVDKKPEVPEGGVMLDFDMDDDNSGPQQTMGSHQPTPPVVPRPQITEELKKRIIKEVTVDLISPTALSSQVNLPVEKIRKIIKDAGLKLPNRYKVTSSKSATAPSTPAAASTTNQTDEPKSLLVAQPGNVAGVVKLVAPAGATSVRTPDGATLQLPQKSVPQTIVLPRQGGSGGITIVTPVTKAADSDKKDPNKPKYIPGKSALCKMCGTASPDFNTCIRCKRPLPKDCKVVEDKNSAKGGDVKGAGKPGSAEKVDSLRNVRILGKKKRAAAASDEPECIALSSDEDGDDDEDGSEPGEGDSKKDDADVKKKTEDQLFHEQLAKEVEAIIAPGSNKLFVSLQCRSIRVGSYKSMPREKVHITEKAIQLRVPKTDGTGQLVTLTIKRESIMKILAHFGKSMPLLFLFCTAGECARIRQVLKMTNAKTGLWFDMGSSDETMKRLTILPDKLTEDNKKTICELYKSIIEELDSKHANEILVRSSPKDSKLRTMQMQHVGGTTVLRKIPSQVGSSGPPSGEGNVKYCQYPPTGSSSVSVTMEDYYCLEDESFLNDSVIDFYFKWLQFSGKLSEPDRERTHIFSTFFYKRLTTRPPKQKNKLHPVEDDVNISAAEKRYERVKRWTKKVNIFEKDFIVVPINEHSHWFVAVICFPGLEGCARMDNNEKVQVPESQVRAAQALSQRKKKRKEGSGGSTPTKRVLQIGSTSIIPLHQFGNGMQGRKCKLQANKLSIHLDDDSSDRDEAEASDDDLLDEETEHSILRKVREAENAKKLAAAAAAAQAAKKEGDQKDDDKVASAAAADGKKEEGSEDGNKSEKSSSREASPPASASTSAEAPVPTTEENVQKEVAKIKQPCILIFDSLQTGSRAKVAATLRDWLKCEYKTKMPDGQTREFTKDNMRGCCPKVPQQPNFSDCGVFLLQYIESFFENPLSDYSLPITSLRSWFPKDVVKNKRSRIAKTIRELAAEQNPDKNFVFPELCFTMDTGTGYTDDEDDDDDPLTKGGRCVAAAAKAEGSKDNKDDDGGDEMEEGAGEAATDGDGAPLPEAAAETKDPDARGDANGQGEEEEDAGMFDLEADIPQQTVRALPGGSTTGAESQPLTRISLTTSKASSTPPQQQPSSGSAAGSNARMVCINPAASSPGAAATVKSVIMPRLTASSAAGKSQTDEEEKMDSSPQTSPDSTSHTLPKDVKSSEMGSSGDTQDPSVDSSEDMSSSDKKKRSREDLVESTAQVANEDQPSADKSNTDSAPTSPKKQRVDSS